uniref:Uncharacterized protein n=1 Tax=Arundo donax TaxID=35708 RepID=A0A0A9ABF4_ARUDO
MVTSKTMKTGRFFGF